MGGLGENEGPYHEQRRPFFWSAPIFSVKTPHLRILRPFFGFHRFQAKKMEIA